MVRVFTTLVEQLTARIFNPWLQILDNEAPQSLKKVMQDQKISFKSAPMWKNLSNNSKRDIKTYNNHFITGLATASL